VSGLRFSGPNFKVPPDRVDKYLEFVRTKACCICSYPPKSAPHHWSPKAFVGGMGSKTSDYRTVPLCQRCHDTFHSTGTVPGMDRDETRMLFALEQVDLLIQWNRKREDEIESERSKTEAKKQRQKKGKKKKR
jgi:hypothetical protein